MPKKKEFIETTDENVVGTPTENTNESPAENTLEDIGENTPEQQTLTDDSDIPQTDLEMDEYLKAEEAANGEIASLEENDDLESEPINGTDEIPEDTPQPDMQNESQSDSKPLEPAKRSRRTKKTAENPDSESQSDSTPAAATPRRRRSRANAIVSIDESRSVETSADKHNNNLLDLVESMKSKKILSGMIQGIERSAENSSLSYAVIYHGDFKVIIPAEELTEPPADFRDRSPGDVMHYMITKRLGAEVDYIVKGVDKNGMAAASRLEAMAAKRKEYYFGTDRDGNNLLYEGINAEARVVSVIRAGIFVDLFGVETYIPLRELSYQRGVDAAAQFQPGQRVLVKILSIDRSNRNKIEVAASVKQATENPYEKALRKYMPGSRYVGTVSMVDTNGVFVSLEGGIDCLCSYPKRGRPPRGSRVTVRVIGINHEANRIWGAITHMTTVR